MGQVLFHLFNLFNFTVALFFQSFELPKEEFACHICHKTFAIQANRNKHIKKIHENPNRKIKKRGPKKKVMSAAEQVESAILKEEELARKKHGLSPKVKIERIDTDTLKPFETKNKRRKSMNGRQQSDTEIILEPKKSDVSLELNVRNDGGLEVSIQDEEAQRVERLRMDLQKTIEALETPQRPKRGRQKGVSRKNMVSVWFLCPLVLMHSGLICITFYPSVWVCGTYSTKCW